jgi:hypothetical protein
MTGPGRPGYWHTVPGLTKTCRVIAFDCVMPSSV